MKGLLRVGGEAGKGVREVPASPRSLPHLPTPNLGHSLPPRPAQHPGWPSQAEWGDVCLHYSSPASVSRYPPYR